MPPFDYNNATDEEGIRAVFETIWRTSEIGYVHLACSEANGDNWEEFRKEWPQYKETIVKWCVNQNALGHNVYYGPAIYDIDKVHTSDIANGNKKQSFVKENVLGSFVYGVEHDGTAAPQEALGATESDVTLDAVVTADIASEAAYDPAMEPTKGITIPPPSIIVSSGYEGHEHQYAESSAFLTDISHIENINRRLSYAVKAD